jgi:hypothetical protein
MNATPTLPVMVQERPDAVTSMAASMPLNTTIQSVIIALASDAVAKVSGLGIEDADHVMGQVAAQLNLLDNLKLQASFADLLDHRRRVGDFFMTVNSRAQYEIISPHSEGTRAVGMQLASFYCVQNTTNGGETTLFNVDNFGSGWASAKELQRRGRPLGPVFPRQMMEAGLKHKVRPPFGGPIEGDVVLGSRRLPDLNLEVFDVLAPAERSMSAILGTSTYVYWDSIGSVDSDASDQFIDMLRADGKLRMPTEALDNARLDNASASRVWRSGVKFSDLFKRKVTLKPCSGELIIFNNMTWAHSVSNWTPESGHRELIAAFA